MLVIVKQWYQCTFWYVYLLLVPGHNISTFDYETQKSKAKLLINGETWIFSLKVIKIKKG